MKIKTTPLLFAAILSVVLPAAGQVPNGGFESWTNGSPNNWLCTNIPTVVANVTQATPAYSGSTAVKGEVINFSGSPYSPLLASTDAMANGFAVSQSYANFSFYYKMNITGTATFEASLTFYDSGGGWVASSGGIFTAGTTGSYTLANFPINYGSFNPPAECVIIFAIHDTVAPDPPIGNYFIVDDVTLSGIAGVDENTAGKYSATTYPNPATDFISIRLEHALNNNAEITVYDVMGKTVKKFFSAEGSPIRFPVTELPRGIYTVRIASGKQQWMTKLVKE